MKIPRLKKTRNFFAEFVGREQFFYENILELQALLSKQMKQDKNSKTILFALKMFHYGARVKYSKFVVAPYEI
jgi:DNA-(apurinic or apyrimidinic site) lyase